MRLICFWCAILALAFGQNQEDGYYTPQTFRDHIESYQKGLFTPTGRNEIGPQQPQNSEWRGIPAPAPAPVQEPWRNYGPGPLNQQGPILSKSAEPWQAPFRTKEQTANILHHKQALTSEGNFRYEYASDNGLAAGEVIEPDGSRVGAYQYKDPSGQVVKLKYRAGKDGFQILEGSHVPKSPEPLAPETQDAHYRQAYEEQRRQYDLQQQYNQQKHDPQQWAGQNQNYEAGSKAAAGHYSQNWSPAQEDDGQYRENEVENAQNRGPHTFGEGYAFAFQG